MSLLEDAITALMDTDSRIAEHEQTETTFYDRMEVEGISRDEFKAWTTQLVVQFVEDFPAARQLPPAAVTFAVTWGTIQGLLTGMYAGRLQERRAGLELSE